MGSEAVLDRNSSPTLPLFSFQPMQSPEHSGMLTPLHTLASVPFRWEEEPGKPRPPCSTTTHITVHPNNKGPKCLKLPPRLLFKAKSIKNIHSPTTVLDKTNISAAPSFRIISKRELCLDSKNMGHERGQTGTMILGKKLYKETKSRGLFGSWGQKNPKLEDDGKKRVGGGCFVFPSSMDIAGCDDGETGGGTRMKMARIIGNGSCSPLSHAKSQFRAAAYEVFKKVISWRRKSNKDGFSI
ncbi:unnamed protein product [Ilex paraguariensis]|uniref:Uncharacterized protein n=1 Tax=Ilex paraguariensis TaxID=185542 RepID=A0ABC8SD47_9AQUA